jgi:hypothetical protein
MPSFSHWITQSAEIKTLSTGGVKHRYRRVSQLTAGFNELRTSRTLSGADTSWLSPGVTGLTAARDRICLTARHD